MVWVFHFDLTFLNIILRNPVGLLFPSFLTYIRIVKQVFFTNPPTQSLPVSQYKNYDTFINRCKNPRCCSFAIYLVLLATIASLNMSIKKMPNYWDSQQRDVYWQLSTTSTDNWNRTPQAPRDPFWSQYQVLNGSRSWKTTNSWPMKDLTRHSLWSLASKIFGRQPGQRFTSLLFFVNDHYKWRPTEGTFMNYVVSRRIRKLREALQSLRTTTWTTVDLKWRLCGQIQFHSGNGSVNKTFCKSIS